MDSKNTDLISSMNQKSLPQILFQIADDAMCTAAFFVRGTKILIGLRNYTSGPVWTTPGGRCVSSETIED
jgi:hypothetical protein